MGTTGFNSSNTLERSLSSKPFYVPKTISNLLSDLAKIKNVEEKLYFLNDYLKNYEEELARVMPRQHELPQCMLLLVEAIEIIKGEIVKTINRNNIIDEEESDDPRRVDEFLKGKKITYENDQQMSISRLAWSSYQKDNRTEYKEAVNLSPESKSIQGIELDGFGPKVRANQSLKLFEKDPSSNPTGKARTRIRWTNELHERFLCALSYLGGFKVATPKRITEIMNVKGLTTEQVKSHLQKHRMQMKSIGGTMNEINYSYHNSTVSAHYDQSYNHIGIWDPKAEIPPLFAPNMAQILLSDDGQQNDVVTTAANNDSPNRNFAGWHNHFGLSREFQL